MSNDNQKTSITTNIKNMKWWQATIMIVSILLSGAVFVHFGGNLTIDLELQAQLDYLETQINIPVNSSVSAMVKEANYIIAPHGSYYCLFNGTDDRAGRLEFYSTNKTLVEQYALGNMTSGLLFLKEVVHNASLTLEDDEMVLESYQGRYRWYSNQGLFYPPQIAGDPSSLTTGAFWFDTVIGKYKFYDGSTIQVLPSVTGTGAGNYTLPFSYIVYKVGSTYYAEDEAGNIDYSGTSITTVGNSAIDAASGGGIFFRAGTYAFTGSNGLDMDQTGAFVAGNGYDTIFTGNALSDDIIDVSAANCWVQNLQIDGTGQSAIYDGIAMQGASASGLRVFNVLIQSCAQDGIHIGSGSGDGWQGNWAKIHTCQIKNNGRYGIYLDYDATDTEMYDLTISGHNGAGDAGLNIESDNVRISSCHLWGNENEMLIAEERSVSGALFSNMGFMDGGGQGTSRVYHASNSYNLKDSTFVGCEFWAAKLAGTNTTNCDGMYMAGGMISVTITGCTFRGADEDDTPIEGRYAVYIDASANSVIILGNTVRNFGMAAPIYSTGSTSCEIAHNTYYNCG